MKKKIFPLVLRTLLLFLFLPLSSLAQGVRYDNVALKAISSTGLVSPISDASIAVCTATASTTTTPCAPLATIYTDATDSTTSLNPFVSDSLGNFGFWAAPGKYQVQIYGSGITPNVRVVVLACDPSNSCTTESLNNIRFASLFPGSDVGAQIANAIANLPTTGGVVYVNGGGTVATDAFAGVTKPGQLVFTDGVYLGNRNGNNYVVQVPSNWEVICAPNVVLRLNPGADQFTNFFYTGTATSNIKIRGCELDGNYANISVAAAALTPATTGGSLATGTYFVGVQAALANGNFTPVLNEPSVAVTGPTGSIAASWTAFVPAYSSVSSYRVFIGTTGVGSLTQYFTSTVTSLTLTTATGTTGTDNNVQNHAIQVQSTDGVWIERNYAHDWNGDGVILEGFGTGETNAAQNFHVNENKFAAIHRADVSFISASKGEIKSNVMNRTINFDAIHQEPGAQGDVGHDITIAHNKVYCPTTGLAARAVSLGGVNGDTTLNTSHITVDDNYSFNCGGLSNNSSVPFVTWTNNHITNPPVNEAFVLSEVRNQTVTGNQIVFGALASTSNLLDVGGIELICDNTLDLNGGAAGIGGSTIADNYIEGAPNVGILLKDCGDNSVHGNVIRNVQNIGGVQFGRGIATTVQALASVDANTFSNNFSFDDRTTHQMTYGLTALDNTNLTLIDNTSKGFLTAGYLDVGGNSYFERFGNTGIADLLVGPIISGSPQAIAGSIGYAGAGELNINDGTVNHVIPTRDSSDSLTNKTYVSPVISSNLPNTTFGVARTSVAGSVTALAANSCGDTVTVTVTGAATTMGAHASGIISAGLIERAWVSAANTVSVMYCNVTTASITPAAATLQVTVIQ